MSLRLNRNALRILIRPAVVAASFVAASFAAAFVAGAALAQNTYPQRLSARIVYLSGAAFAERALTDYKYKGELIRNQWNWNTALLAATTSKPKSIVTATAFARHSLFDCQVKVLHGGTRYAAQIAAQHLFLTHCACLAS